MIGIPGISLQDIKPKGMIGCASSQKRIVVPLETLTANGAKSEKMKQMRWYRYLFLALGLAVVLAAGWTAFQFSSSSRINTANFAKIKEGMGPEEVYAILGRPYICFGGTAFWSSLKADPSPWTSHEVSIIVCFDMDYRQVEHTFITIHRRSFK